MSFTMRLSAGYHDVSGEAAALLLFLPSLCPESWSVGRHRGLLLLAISLVGRLVVVVWRAVPRKLLCKGVGEEVDGERAEAQVCRFSLHVFERKLVEAPLVLADLTWSGEQVGDDVLVSS